MTIDYTEILPGEFYEDYHFQPCLCTSSHEGELEGISLVDGSYPRSDDALQIEIRKLSLKHALHWKFYGPPDVNRTRLRWLSDFEAVSEFDRKIYKLSEAEIDEWIADHRFRTNR